MQCRQAAPNPLGSEEVDSDSSAPLPAYVHLKRAVVPDPLTDVLPEPVIKAEELLGLDVQFRSMGSLSGKRVIEERRPDGLGWDRREATERGEGGADG